ncbi:Neuromedin-B [Galemys pyrenaicus]|uniref:Neuromedin-B n=1 Tax=Galemys pyrenaicus TaxID=202257 RepID=A0A8J6A793_GALPY|nr:Neuromedin-B [Galemys pyrenaicus]
MARRAGRARLLGRLLLLALLAAALAWDLAEPRSRARRIRVHPRGNLWATGHFMGKKSPEPPSPMPLGSTPHLVPRGPRLQPSHDLPRLLLLRQALGRSPGSPAPPPQVSLQPVRSLDPALRAGHDCGRQRAWCRASPCPGLRGDSP